MDQPAHPGTSNHMFTLPDDARPGRGSRAWRWWRASRLAGLGVILLASPEIAARVDLPTGFVVPIGPFTAPQVAALVLLGAAVRAGVGAVRQRDAQPNQAPGANAPQSPDVNGRSPR